MASKKRSEQRQWPGWAWMLMGLSIGLGVALVVYLDSSDLRISDSLRELASDVRDAPATLATESVPIENDSTPESADETSGADEEPALSFYTRLRDSEVIIPGASPATVTEASLTEASLTETVELQAGSFPSLERADSRQATLALIGIPSRIDEAIVDNDLHFRVVIGPLTELDELNRIAARLDREEIEYFRRRVAAVD